MRTSGALRPGLGETVGSGDDVRPPEALAELGFDVNVWARITPPHQAAYDGDVAVVRALLDVGADPSCGSLASTPPLGWAQHARRTEVVELLETRTGQP